VSLRLVPESGPRRACAPRALRDYGFAAAGRAPAISEEGGR
jgi:hypothetical protein